MIDAVSLYAEMNAKAQKLILESSDEEGLISTLKDMSERLDQFIYRKYKPCAKCGLPIVNKEDMCKVEGSKCEVTSDMYDWARFYNR